MKTHELYYKITPTPDMIAAAKTVFMAKAWVDTIRPVVEGYKKVILAKHGWHIDEKWIDKGMTDKVILDPEHAYELSDQDFAIYLKEVKEARIQSGLKVDNEDFCPLLVAERLEMEAIRSLLTTMISITKIDPDDVYGEHWNKLTDLTLRLLAPYVK